MPPHDRLDLARVLLARAVDDETLVRKVRSDADVADSIVGFHVQGGLRSEQLIDGVGHSLSMIDAWDIPANQVRTTASYRPKTGVVGMFSNAPWPLIRRLHGERFGA